MKKLAVLVLFFVVTICNAQVSLEINQDGEYRAEKVEKWKNSGIVADEGAMNYIERFSIAIDSPGTSILVDKSEKILKLKTVFKKLVEVKEFFIVYDKSIKKISLIEVSEEREDSSFLILFLVALLFIMILLKHII